MDDDTEIDPAIAEAMGFSSFGTKRRKHNPKDDIAVVAKNASTGANDIPLGAPRAARAEPRNSDEVAVAAATSVVATEAVGHEHSVDMDVVDMGVREQRDVQSAGPKEGALVGGSVEGEEEWTQGWPSREELAMLRRGVKNSKGDMVVFLPGFVEDPWRELR